MTRSRIGALALALTLFLVGWSTFHIELMASFPKEDAALTEAPTEMWLEFSVVPDPERSSFSVRGPDGRVKLGAMTVGATAESLKAAVEGPLPAGSYTVSWIAAPLDDHTVRGRYRFTIDAGG